MDSKVEGKEFSFVTEHNTHEICYEWSLTNFRPSDFGKTELIDSPSFPSMSIIESSLWSFKIYFQKVVCIAEEKEPVNDITIKLVSYLDVEDLAKHHPRLNVAFELYDDNSVSLSSLKPSKEVKFDGTGTEVEVFVIKDVMNIPDITNSNCLFFSFDCSLSTNVLSVASNDRLKTLHKKFVWKIDQFHQFISMNNGGSCIETLQFDFLEELSLAINNDDLFETRDPTLMHKWILQIYPRGRDERFKDYVSIFLKHCYGPAVQAIVEFRLEGETKKQMVMVMPQQLFTRGRRWGIGEYLRIDSFNDKFGDSVKIICRIKLIYFCTKLVEDLNLVEYSNKNALRFLMKLYQDFKDESHCDICLRSTIDQRFQLKLHKCVLFSSSKSFEREHEARNRDPNNNEEQTNELPILTLNYSKECIERFAKFLYKHELDANEAFQVLRELLHLAIDYEVHSLKRDCCNNIIKNHINHSTVFPLLNLDAKYLKDDLRKAVFNYLKRYYNQLSELPEWKALLKSNQGFCSDILSLILS